MLVRGLLHNDNGHLMDLKKAALQYAAEGLKIFPITPGRKNPPLVKWSRDATTSPAEINSWWNRAPRANIGFAAGQSEIAVLDIDVKEGRRGRETLDRLEIEEGKVLSPTRMLRTPSGGLHLLYRGRIPTSQNVIGRDLWDDRISHIDTRGYGGAGGYTLLPPSQTVANRTDHTHAGMYEWINGANFPIEPLDQWVIDLFEEYDSTRSNNAPQEFVVDADADAEVAWFVHYLEHDAPIAIEGEGGEFRTLTTIAGTAKDRGISEDVAFDLIFNSTWNDRCEPPWEYEELQVKVHNAYEYLKQNKPGERALANDPIYKEPPEIPVEPAAVQVKRDVDTKPEENEFDDLADVVDNTGDHVDVAPQRLPPPPALPDDLFDDLFADKPSAPPTSSTTPISDVAAEFSEADDFSDLLTDKRTLTPYQEAKAAILKRDADQPERIWSFTELCEEWVYVSQMDRFLLEADPTVMFKTEQFNKRFAYAKPDTTKLKTLSEFMFSKMTGTIRKPIRAVFIPGEPSGMLPSGDYNMYRASDIVPKAGDTDVWDQHLQYLWPKQEDRDHVLNWCAWLLQNLSLKPKHVLLLAGHKQGTGKSFISDVMTRIVGKPNVSPVGSIELSSSFNKWALGSKLLTIEELDALEKTVIRHTLHPIITQETLTINDKGIQTFPADNCFGILAMTNEDAAIRLTNEDRRYLVVRTHAQPRHPHYYNDLYSVLDDQQTLAAIAYQLMTRNVGDYNGQGRAPETEAKREMVEASMSDLELWMTDNAGIWPLAGRIIAVSDIIEILPSNVARTPRLATAIGSILRHRFNGTPLGICPLPSGVRTRLWAINTSGITSIKGINYGGIYASDKAKRTTVGAGNDAVAEFSEE